MQKIKDFFERGAIPTFTLAATAFAGLATLLGVLVVPSISPSKAEMRIEPETLVVTEGETATIDIVVSASVPVNAFAGELRFNSDVLRVESIDYNTSIADLWAELPWYHNGDGTLTFAGGTTRRGAFFGTGSLITVHFLAIGEGHASLAIYDARILQHDGLGTDIPQEQPIDALLTVEESEGSNALQETTIPSDIAVVREYPNTDLSGDGRTSIADISIFMVHLPTNNPRSDFNDDGDVNTRDFSILMDAIRRE